MLDTTTDTQKIVLSCRFIQHDQWLTTHVQPTWTIRQLKLWFIHRLFGISIPARTFNVPALGQPSERPPSPITFAPDPRHRPSSPIVFAAPQKSGFYSSVGGGASGNTGAAGGERGNSGGVVRGLLSDTDEDLLSGSESGFSSTGKGKGKARAEEIRIETGPPVADPSGIPGGRIGPSPHGVSDTESTSSRIQIQGHTVASHTTAAGYTPPDADRYPGGVNPNHWTLTRYSTGQILADEEVISWFPIAEFELLELHGLSFPSIHPLYEYQVCHLWNPDRHRERERLRKKLKKRFEAEAARMADKKDKDGTGNHAVAAAKRAATQAQILKAMNLNSGAGANVGVVEYYGHKLDKTTVELTLTRIPRSIDVYVQPYWEGWVRTLRIVWRGDWSDVAFHSAASGHAIPIHMHPALAASAVGASVGFSGGVPDPYKYGAYSAGASHGGMGMSVYQGHPGTVGDRDEGSSRSQRIVRVEWRERWVRIQNGTLVVLKDRENEDATHVLPLKNIISLTNTQHLVRYLSYTGFNPPTDHPAVNPDTLVPALHLPIQRPVMPTGHSSYYSRSYSHSSTSGSSSSKHKNNLSGYNPAYPDSDSDHHHHHRSSHHGHSGSSHGHGSHHGSFDGGKEYNFYFPSYSHLHAHMKARELTPLVGSRFDPTYLPITIDEQKASGLRVVCLQFRKQSSSAANNGGVGAGASSRPSVSSYYAPGMKPDDHGLGLWNDRMERERDNEIDPVTLALEDMKERADEWGGVRSDSILWKCPAKHRREPTYLTRAKTRMKIRPTKASSRTIHNTSAAYSSGKSVKSSARSSTIRGLGDTGLYDYNYKQPASSNVKKERHYDRERRHQRNRTTLDTTVEVDVHGIIAAQIFGGGLPGPGKSYKETVEERERKEQKERRKREKEREKELMKERAKQEKELRGKGKGKGKEKEKEEKEEKEKDWNLGSLNVAFWKWGQKKKAKKESERDLLRQRAEEHERRYNARANIVSSSPSAFTSTSTVQLNTPLASTSTATIGAGPSTISIGASSGPTGSSVTVIGGSSSNIIGVPGLEGVGTQSSEDEDDDQIEFAQYGRSETSAATTEDDEEDEDEEDEDEEDEDEDAEGEGREEEEEEDQEEEEPYPDAVPENPPVVEEEDESELIEYADPPVTATTSVENGSQQGDGLGNSGTTVAVDKRVDTEADPRSSEGNKPNTAIFRGSMLPSPRETLPASGFPSTKAISIDTNVSGGGPSSRTGGAAAGSGQVVTKKTSQRLIGQLHSSEEEAGEDLGDQENDEEELSSPVFAPPPQSRKPFRVKSQPPPSNQEHARSVSSQGSNAPVDRKGEEGEEYDYDDDLDDVEFFGPRRPGYRYGLYDTRKDEDRKRKAESLEEQKEREAARRKELKELEEREKERERIEREREKERERREKKKREEEGEWVCLDIGNDFAFQSFLRIMHQYCPHPMKSTFMDRMMGGPLNDAPPPPQKLPQPLVTNAYPESSAGPSSPSVRSHQSHPSSSQSQADAHVCIESVLRGEDSSNRPSIPNSPVSSISHHTTSSRAFNMSPPSRQSSVPTSPSAPSIPPASSPSPYDLPPSPPASSDRGSAAEADDEIDSEAEYVTPLPGYTDRRFMYPSRTFATPPYPEWRLNVMRKAQHAGMGDVGRAMEFIHWGREDPVVSNATGAANELDRMDKRWEMRGGLGRLPGGGGGKGDLRGQREKSGWSDNVSSLGTIGPRTVGSGGTVKGLSPKEQRKRLSYSGRALRSPRSTGSVKNVIPEAEREGGSSGNESSGENSDGSPGGHTSASDLEKPTKSKRKSNRLSSRLTKWSDEEEDYASELEWTAWHLDIRRQAKRQYAIQARRDVNPNHGMTREVDLGVPLDPMDDMRRYLKKRYETEHRARVTQGMRVLEEPTTAPVSLASSLSGTRSVPSSSATNSTIGTSPPRLGPDTLSPYQHGRTPSQQYHTLHHSASLHTGLRKMQDVPLRRPSMPALNVHAEKEREKEKSSKGKGFWNIAGLTGPNDAELRSPTTATSSSGWFSSRKEGKDKEKEKEREREAAMMMVPPSGGTASQPVSASASVGRLKGGLLRKKDSGDITREIRERERVERGDRERGPTRMMNEAERAAEMKKGPRPQLWVATSSSAATASPSGAAAAVAESSKSPEHQLQQHVRSPTFVPGRFVKRMRSDVSLSLRANTAAAAAAPDAVVGPEPSSPRQAKKKKGTMGKLFDSSMNFVDGLD